MSDEGMTFHWLVTALLCSVLSATTRGKEFSGVDGSGQPLSG